MAYDQELAQCEKDYREISDAYNSASVTLERQRSVIAWIGAWISNPVGSYSVSDLDGLFNMTRDKIAALTANRPMTSTDQGETK